MFKPCKTENNPLEIFRIKAHLRCYIIDPNTINNKLLQDAAAALKKLPYENKDPTAKMVKKMVVDAYRRGYFTYDNLTDAGYQMVQYEKYRRYPLTNTGNQTAYVAKHRNGFR